MSAGSIPVHVTRDVKTNTYLLTKKKLGILAMLVHMTDSEFLMWIYERLQYVYGVSVNCDYMHRLKLIALSMEESDKKTSENKKSSYQSLLWVEDFDYNDNKVYEAASTVYNHDDCVLYYRITPHLMGGKIVWKLNSSNKELLTELYDVYDSLEEAKDWCEKQNLEAYNYEISQL